MQLSLRSQLIAGVAAIGATTVAITPIAQPELLPTVERVSASVQLSAFANPVTALLETLAFASEDLFYQGELPELFWPASFFGSDDYFYGPLYFGLVPSAVNQFSSGPVSAVINNISSYVDIGIFGATAALGGVADSVWNTPFALATAAQLALAGDVEAALAELQNQIVVPLQDGIAVALDAVGYIVDNVINNVQTVISSTVPRLIAGLVDQVGSAGEFLLQEAVATATAIVTSLTSGDVEGAWNAAVNGLLGPPGLLSSVELLTVGIGVVETVDGVEEVVYPSVRSVLTSEAQRLGDFSENGDGGIRNTPYGVEPAPAAAEAAAAEVAAEAADSDAPEAVTSGVDVRAASAEAAEADAASADAASAEAASASSVRSASSDDSDEAGAQSVADADSDGAAAGASDDSAPAESAADESAAEKPEGPVKKRERASARSAR